MKRLTKEQAIILSAYTGCIMCDIKDIEADVVKRIGEMPKSNYGSLKFHEDIKDAYQADFLKLCVKEN